MSMQRKKPLINEMAKQDRPREKFERLGAQKLTDAELLALILRTGTQNLSAVALSKTKEEIDICKLEL